MSFRTVVDTDGHILVKAKSEKRIQKVLQEPGARLIDSYPPSTGENSKRIWMWEDRTQSWVIDTQREQALQDREQAKRKRKTDADQAYAENETILAGGALTPEQIKTLFENSQIIIKELAPNIG